MIYLAELIIATIIVALCAAAVLVLVLHLGHAVLSMLTLAVNGLVNVSVEICSDAAAGLQSWILRRRGRISWGAIGICQFLPALF